MATPEQEPSEKPVVVSCDKRDVFHFSSNEYSHRLLGDFKQLYESKLFTDVRICVDTRSVAAHKVVLAACSPYFHALFGGQLREAQTEGDIDIRGLTFDIFEMIMEFIYTGQVDITPVNCQDLLAAADMLEIPELLSGCSTYLEEHLSTDNSIGIYLFADAHSCHDLKVVAESYIHKNFLCVSREEEFLSLPADSLIHLLHSEHLHIEAELQVFIAAMNWILHDVKLRRPEVFDIMAVVRIPIIPLSHLDKYISDVTDLGLQIALRKHCHDCQKERKQSIVSNISTKPCVIRPRQGAQRKLFIIGGYSRDAGARWSDSRSMCNVEQFNTFHQTWQTSRAMRSPRSGHGTTVLNGLIYVAGGESDSLIYDSAECYDPVMQTWTRLAAMTLPRCGLGVCSCGDSVYALGGWVGSQIGSSIEKYTPQLEQWQTVGVMRTVRFAMGVVEVQGLIYVIGGMTDVGTELRITESYNPVTQEWCQLCPMQQRRSHLTVGVLDGHIYAVGGWNESQGCLTSLDTVERYDIDKDKWQELPPLTTPRAGACTAGVNGLLYVIGGRSSSEAFSAPPTLSSVECFDPHTETWFPLGNIHVSRSEAGLAVL